MTAVRRRDLLRQLVEAAGDDSGADAAGTAPPAHGRNRPVCAAGDPAFDYFGSFDACHTLLAEIRPLLDAEVRRLGLDTTGKTDWQIAREVFAFQPPPPAPARAAPDRDTAAGPPGDGENPGNAPGGHEEKED